MENGDFDRIKKISANKVELIDRKIIAKTRALKRKLC